MEANAWKYIDKYIFIHTLGIHGLYAGFLWVSEFELTWPKSAYTSSRFQWPCFRFLATSAGSVDVSVPALTALFLPPCCHLRISRLCHTPPQFCPLAFPSPIPSAQGESEHSGDRTGAWCLAFPLVLQAKLSGGGVDSYLLPQRTGKTLGTEACSGQLESWEQRNPALGWAACEHRLLPHFLFPGDCRVNLYFLSPYHMDRYSHSRGPTLLSRSLWLWARKPRRIRI